MLVIFFLPMNTGRTVRLPRDNMNNTELNQLFSRWRAREQGTWTDLKPELARALRRTRPALGFPPEHLTTIRGLLCLRLDMSEEDELRDLPGDRFWEFFASLSRSFLIELLREGSPDRRPVSVFGEVPEAVAMQS